MTQSMPVQGNPNSRSVFDGLLSDIEKRKQVGIETYGVELQTHNGRSGLLDAYEEVLDTAVYLKQRLMEEEDARYEINFDKFAEDVGAWGDTTFPESTFKSILAHARKELDELEISARNNNVLGVREEVADVVLLMVHVAHRFEINLRQAMIDKFAKLLMRKDWVPSSEGTHWEHTRTGDDNG